MVFLLCFAPLVAWTFYCVVSMTTESRPWNQGTAQADWREGAERERDAEHGMRYLCSRQGVEYITRKYDGYTHSWYVAYTLSVDIHGNPVRCTP